jgi:hypothetical protein
VGCLKKPSDSELNPSAPKVIYVPPTYKVYPIVPLEPLESVTIYPLSTPGIVGGILESDVKAIQRNTVKMIKWGVLNQQTIQEINLLADEKEKGAGE